MSPAGASREVVAVVAAFDVDGTLTTHDCVVPFLRRVAGTARLAAGLMARPQRLVPALVRRNRDSLKAQSAKVAFGGRAVAEIDTEATEFAAVVHRDHLRADTIATLRGHQADGHDVVLVSASFAVYLRPLARLIGVDHVLATELEVDSSGHRYTGALAGRNCRGDEKVARLHRWLDERSATRRDVELWAYGDSAGDRAMLSDADHAVWVTGAVAAT